MQAKALVSSNLVMDGFLLWSFHGWQIRKEVLRGLTGGYAKCFILL